MRSGPWAAVPPPFPPLVLRCSSGREFSAVGCPLDSPQQVLGKRPLIVHPLRFRAEAASNSQFGDLPSSVLMTALRPDGLARTERHREAAVTDIHHLPPLRPQMHLDT